MPPRPAHVSPSQSQASLSQSDRTSSPATSSKHDTSTDPNDTLLPRLATYLVAAKRSLASTALVQRADALVSTARKSIEDIAALSARNAYLRDYATRELRVLERIRSKLDGIKDKGSGEFKLVLRTLDASDERVKRTLHLLKTTPVEPSFQPSSTAEFSSKQPAIPIDLSHRSSVDVFEAKASSQHDADQSPSEAPKQKFLYDFVSEQGVDDLTRVFRECIDATNAAAPDFTNSMEDFDANIQSISALLTPSSPSSALPGAIKQESLPQPPRHDPTTPSSQSHIPALFRSLEANATEVADLLQSLVRHYDLCVTALKHTEGGGEAAAKAHAQAQIDMPGGLPDLAEGDVSHEPISEEEWVEMMQVLEKDALEVDDVVQDIRDHESEMEEQLETILATATAMKTDHSRLRKAVKSLEELGGKLTLYISAGSTFMDRWAVQKSNIQDKMEELDGLRDFYDGFLGAYDGLILEIGRRKVVQSKMEKNIADAMVKVAKLRDEDAEERNNFKADQGEFLPSDIWPGLVEPPARFEIRRVHGDITSLPDVSKEAMQRAMQRHGKTSAY